MSVQYTRNKGSLNHGQLKKLINSDPSITKNCDGFLFDGSTITIYMDDTLSGAEETTLYSLVDGHTPNIINPTLDVSIFSGNTAPTVDDDGVLGYSLCDVWVDTSTGYEYSLMDDTEGSAVWVKETDTFVTGGTMNGDTLELYRNDNGQLTVDLSQFNDGGSSENVSETFTKTSHGLVVGNVVKHDGPNAEDFSKAKADAAATSQAMGIVSVVNGNDFTVTYLGKVTGLAGLTTGVNYLSDVTAGAVTATEPSGISKPILFATSSSEAIIMIERGLQGTTPTTTSRRGHTWGISSEIKVPSGDTDFLIPFFIDLASGETAKISKARYRINSGTSATVKLQKNGVDVTGFVGISITTTDGTTDPSDVTITSGDKLALVVTAVAGTPKNMTFTLFIDYTI